MAKSSIRITRGGRSMSFRGPIAAAVFAGMTAAAKPAPTFKSIAKWPAGEVQLGNAENESVDTHGSREAAEGVCRRLREQGFGGDGKIFPLETRVEEVPAT